MDSDLAKLLSLFSSEEKLIQKIFFSKNSRPTKRDWSHFHQFAESLAVFTESVEGSYVLNNIWTGKKVTNSALKHKLTGSLLWRSIWQEPVNFSSAESESNVDWLQSNLRSLSPSSGLGGNDELIIALLDSNASTAKLAEMVKTHIIQKSIPALLFASRKLKWRITFFRGDPKFRDTPLGSVYANIRPSSFTLDWDTAVTFAIDNPGSEKSELVKKSSIFIIECLPGVHVAPIAVCPKLREQYEILLMEEGWCEQVTEWTSYEDAGIHTANFIMRPGFKLFWDGNKKVSTEMLYF